MCLMGVKEMRVRQHMNEVDPSDWIFTSVPDLPPRNFRYHKRLRHDSLLREKSHPDNR